MQSSVGIRERIDHVYPSLRPAERAVAQYIRNHIEEAADLTVGQMADIAHVSQPTVIRFARKLGFGGYRELRYVLRNPAAEHKVTFNPLAGFDLNPWDGEDEIPGKAADGAKALIDDIVIILRQRETTPANRFVGMRSASHSKDILRAL